MLRLLFVEDDPNAVESVRDLVSSEPDLEDRLCNFEEAKETIRSYQPDIVILDLWAGDSPEDGAEGLNTRELIWQGRFCPIVIYSAAPDPYDGEHPLEKVVKKGRGSPERVLSALNELRPQVDALKEAEEYIRQSFANAMRDVAPYAFNFGAGADTAGRNEIVIRAGRRRLAAQMDDLSIAGPGIASWEQYLFPPVSRDLKLADVLRETDGSVEDPASFRLVLSPSCDMVGSGGRSPKVKRVLTAACCSMREGLNRAGLEKWKKGTLRARLESEVLSRGFRESIVPIPALPQRIPTMAADMRDLQLIPFSEIGSEDEGKKFIRIASIDSPFREAVAWAYLQSAGRPGVPTRELRAWRDEILSALPNGGGSA